MSYLLPFLISTAISLGVGVYCYRRRLETGAMMYALVAYSQVSWTVGYIFELLSPSLESKIFWDNFQFIGGVGWLVAFVAFTFEYTGRRISRPRLFYGLLSIPGIAIVLLAFTDPLHKLVRPQAWLIPGVPFSSLQYDFTLPVWIWGIYGYGVFLVCISMLAIKYVRTHPLFRTQVGLILVGNLAPLIGTMLTLSGIIQGPYRDISPFTFAIGNVIVAWGLFRYRLFDIVPLAWDKVIENISDAVVVLDSQNRVIDLNPAAQKNIDRPISEVIGQPAAHVFSDWPDLVELYQDLAEAHTEIVVDTDGEQRNFDLILSSLRDRRDRITGRVVIVRDITERMRAEKVINQRTLQLEAANIKLEAANERLLILSRTKDQFVSNVSHELRTPVTNLKLYIDLLAQQPEKHDSYLDVLNRETERLERMIEGLLALSRLDQDRMTVNLEPVDLNALAEEYVNDRAALAGRKGLAIEIEPEPELLSVNSDRYLIGQVLSILLTNALNYTPAGGQVVVSTQMRQSQGQQWAGFSVRDTGPGISSEEQGQLFTRFFRGKAGRDSQVPGTGLGLAIVKEIIGRHHGQIEVESEGVAGKGATFSVWLPVQEI